MKKKQQQIFVLTLGSILAIGFLWLMVTMGDEDSNVSDNVEQIFDSKTGEASYINFSFPSKNDSLVIDESLTEHYERLIRDSLNKLNIDKISLSSGQTEKIAGFTVETDSELTPNSRLDFSEVEPIIKEVDPYQNSNDWLKPKTSSASNSSYNSSDNYNSNGNNSNSQVNEYKRLLDAKKLQLEHNSDISRDSKPEASSNEPSDEFEKINIRASIFKTQFIVPGDRVKLILTQPLIYKGNIFERNTTLYAFASIKGSRVLLDIQNINGVLIKLKAVDIQDNIIGVYSKRAAELWEEFEEESNDNTINEITQNTGINNSLITGTLRSLGNFFKKKKLKNNEKIPLLNDQEVILINSQ